MIADRHLVPLKPRLFRDFPCPSCGSMDVEAHGAVFPGIHVLADYRCKTCGLEFLRDLPVGFAVDHPMAIEKRNGKLFNPFNGDGWIHVPLLEGWRSPSDAPLGIERIVHVQQRRVVILNTLDYLYGHVLLKLFNAQHYLDRHSDLGLVLILPRMYQWLVPKGTAEVWLVDQKLSQAHGWHRAMDAFVQEQLARFDEVYLAPAYAHPEFADINIERFTGLEPFPLKEYLTRPPCITFIAREDRMWFGGPFGKFCHRALRKLGLKGVAVRWAVHAQSRLIRRTMRRIRAALPDVRFHVVGLGTPGDMGTAVNDLRTRTMDRDTELAWCKAYAASQIVIGVHGSNMLLPTAFAAGCIEILPHDRFGNIVQDVSVRWHDRMQLFLYRFVDEFAHPREVARHAVSMFNDYAVYHRDNRINIFRAS